MMAMRKTLIMITAATLLTQHTAGAAPGTYQDFLRVVDEIEAKSVLPVADLPQRTIPAKLSGQVLAVANSMLGMPVVWGGASPARGFDCSGLVQYVFRQAGVNLPRTADLQFEVGRTVAKSELQPGDLVYFTTYEPGASHVGIYSGGNKFIHTSFSQGIVAIGDMNDPYFTARYYGAKRI